MVLLMLFLTMQSEWSGPAPRGGMAARSAPRTGELKEVREERVLEWLGSVLVGVLCAPVEMGGPAAAAHPRESSRNPCMRLTAHRPADTNAHAHAPTGDKGAHNIRCQHSQ